MHSFEDSAGRRWSIEISVGALKVVRGLIGIDLADGIAGDPPLMVRLAIDPALMADTLFAIVKPQADALGVSDEDFGRALAGKAFQAGFDAFFAEWQDFFREALKRPEMDAAIAKGLEIMRMGTQEALTRIQELALTFGDSSTGSPESSESIPIHSRSAS